MTFADLIELLDYNRGRTLQTIDSLAKEADPSAALAFRPGAKRAHVAWQFMHIGATDDRHVHVRMTPGQPQNAEYVRRFAGGSTPDEDVPTLDEIRRYLTEQRAELVNHLKSLAPDMIDKKPNEQANWTYREWIKLLAWHEAHHQGQAHAALNLFKNR